MAAYTILVLLRPAQTETDAPLPGYEFLLVRNARRGDKWELPGGRCNAGEPPEACAARECEEETGHRLLDARLLFERDGPLGHGHTFWGRLGERVGSPDAAEISGMRYAARLPDRASLSFPDDPYEVIFARLRPLLERPGSGAAPAEGPGTPSGGERTPGRRGS